MRSRLREFLLRLRCSVSGVTSRWIFGAFECVLPFVSLTCSRKHITLDCQLGEPHVQGDRPHVVTADSEQRLHGKSLCT